jgi:hypothetical protein
LLTVFGADLDALLAHVPADVCRGDRAEPHPPEERLEPASQIDVVRAHGPVLEPCAVFGQPAIGVLLERQASG